ncbi:MAG: LacI family DNA-binding transcriptional regulator [Gemmatimonadaceae bacterium]
MRIGKRVTAVEVAKLAGVSQPTVSLVLSQNPKARVAPETRARVLKVAEELGYRPNRLAQGLVRRRSFALAIIVPGFANPVNAAIISGAERVAAQAGYAVLLCETGDIDVVQHVRALADRQIDGVIIAGISESDIAHADLRRLNVVLVNQDSEQLSTVRDDSQRAGAMAAEHLLGLGHRRVAFIGPVSSASAFRLRERGFAQALRAAGAVPPSELWQRADATVAGGLAAMTTLLSQPERPTAVFCANDLIALGAHKACALVGVRIPDELSILGCDDIDLGTLVTPELSTISTPQRELGARAVRLLLKQLDGDVRASATTQTLPVKLMLRGTTGAPRARGA